MVTNHIPKIYTAARFHYPTIDTSTQYTFPFPLFPPFRAFHVAMLHSACCSNAKYADNTLGDTTSAFIADVMTII